MSRDIKVEEWKKLAHLLANFYSGILYTFVNNKTVDSGADSQFLLINIGISFKSNWICLLEEMVSILSSGET